MVYMKFNPKVFLHFLFKHINAMYPILNYWVIFKNISFVKFSFTFAVFFCV